MCVVEIGGGPKEAQKTTAGLPGTVDWSGKKRK